MKRALMLWKDRAITVSAVQEACGAGCSIKLKAKENKSTGKKTTAYAAFSGTHWKDDTNTFLKSVMTLSTEDMDTITDLAKIAAKRVMKTEEKASTLTVNDDDDDDDIILCNGSESSESSTHEDGVSAAQIPQWKSHRTFSHFLLRYMVSNVVFKLPKQRDQQSPPIHMKSEFVIKTWIERILLTSGTITPYVLGILKLTLRCTTITVTSTLAPQCIIKPAVRARAIVLIMANLSLCVAMKNTLTRTLPLPLHHLRVAFHCL